MPREIQFIKLLLLFLICVKEIYTWSYNPLCLLKECCDHDSIPGSVNHLRQLLKEKVYGQHLVQEVVHAIDAHWDSRNKPSKALTLSFHGWPGSGKNYVANFIAESLFRKGERSKFVHTFIGRINFPSQGEVEKYKQDLYHSLQSAITSCPKQLFIFDEVDKIPAGVLDAIKPLIDHRNHVEGNDFTRTIFIFLSNTGSDLINKQYAKFWGSGTPRESLTLHNFEQLIKDGAFNEEGGFQYSDAVKSSLIDHYVPFLPMEEKHVQECIRDKFREHFIVTPKEEHIKEVIDYVEWTPESSKSFSKTGCKRISAKVALLVSKHYKKSEL